MNLLFYTLIASVSFFKYFESKSALMTVFILTDIDYRITTITSLQWYLHFP